MVHISEQTLDVSNGSVDQREVAADLYELLTSMETFEDFLGRLAHLAANQVLAPASCGLTVRVDGRPMTVASSDELAMAVDEVQYKFDDGPCLHALASGEVVIIDDLRDDHRWGRYRDSALTTGVRSSLSMPVGIQGRTDGALNLYSKSPGAFGEVERGKAAHLADQAAGALSVAVRLAERAARLEHLQAALVSRKVIDQALGVIMWQQRCSADEAFDVLRAASQNRNVKLRDIAAAVVASTREESPAPKS